MWVELVGMPNHTCIMLHGIAVLLSGQSNRCSCDISTNTHS